MKNIIIAFCIFSVLSSFLFSCERIPEEEKKIPHSPKGDDGISTVLLDPGHGFRDVGCTSDYLSGKYEYELTMDFALRIKKLLEENGINVLLTHDGENIPDKESIISKADALGIEYDKDKVKTGNNIFDAYERTVYANVLNESNEIDLFLSIHVNANANTDTVEGFEIDYCAENSSSQMSVFAFDSICESLEINFPGRQLKKFADSFDMSFIVNKYTNMPSILFETAYATTPAEAERLLSEEWRQSLSESLASGVKAYFELTHK